MDARLQKLLKEHRASFALQPSGKKVVCKLNGHELPVRFDAVDAFIKGKKYARLKAEAEAKNALKKYEPFLVQSRNFEDKLYCALTCQLLGKSLDAVRQHMRGKRFQRAKEQYQNDEMELMDEPFLDAKSEAMEVEAAACGGGGGSEAGGGEDDGLWVPEEYMEMEAQAKAEAAEDAVVASPSEAVANAAAEEAAAAAAAAAAADAAAALRLESSADGNSSASSLSRRPKKPKPKHKAKRTRMA